MDFIETSKRLHAEHGNLPFWPGAFDPNNPDTARHYSLLEPLAALEHDFADSSWLTIGDSRARDAGFLKSRFKGRVTASDLNADERLREAKMKGHVDDVASVDVENIPFPDNCFDFVLAKEAFHHFPRPYLGFYQMLRVARIGVALIEPVDVCLGPIKPYPDDEFRDAYESVGNYKYQVSPREFLKTAWALDLPAVAMKGLNDPFAKGDSLDSWTRKKLHLDALGESGQRQFNLMTIIVFKSISEHALGQLGASMRVYRRPRR